GTDTPAYALDVVTADAIAARFSGRVIGSDAVEDDEFITLGQLGTISAGDYFIQGGNAYGEVATLGTTDNQDLRFMTNNTERMRINSDGMFGFGTDNPAEQFHFYNMGSTTFRIEADSTGNRQEAYLDIVGNAGASGDTRGAITFRQSINNSTVAQIKSQRAGSGSSSSHLIFSTKEDGAGSLEERVIIQNTGNVGIGTDSPTNTLDVDGTVRVRTFGASTANTVCRDGDGVLSICSSNEHLKDNITNLNIGGLDTIRQLQARQFNWKTDGRADLGFIAEEVENINPLLAQYESDGTLSGVKYTQLTALLTQGVQQLDSQAQQDSLRITQAEATIGDLVVASSSYLQNGNSASFSSLNVSGPTNLSNLTVTGNATIQGNLSVEGSLTVANATAQPT
ncbi:MAG: tail fiber domain-containing protein, partial [Actinobacteria bacterium]|nr:tail fiber domain-containing protein [Actinomycetota bacterium]